MIKSMTAYAKTEHRENDLVVNFEIRTYNSRHLDYNIRVPHGYSGLEEKIKERVSKRVSRGRVEMRLFVDDESEGSFAYEVNKQKADAYYEALKQLVDNYEIDGGIPLSLLSNTQGLIVPADVEIDFQTHGAVVVTCVEKTLDELDSMRQAEGDYLKNDFENRLTFIESAIVKIEADSVDLLPVYQKRLMERVKKITDGIVEIDEARIAQEAAILADRSDISEEIVRANSHVQQFRNIMDSDEPGGRKLNFLLQEFNREFNTMGSKSGNADISHLIVEVKSELERLREQVQNVE